MAEVYTCIECQGTFKGQRTRCSTCTRAAESVLLRFESAQAKSYTARELALALLALPEEQQHLPVSLSYPYEHNLVIELSNDPEHAYVWIGDPNA